MHKNIGGLILAAMSINGLKSRMHSAGLYFALDE